MGIKLIIALLVIASSVVSPAKLAAPIDGIYHSCFPGSKNGDWDITKDRIEAYDKLAGKKAVWILFSNYWDKGIEFPADKVRIIDDIGRIPYIRMMPVSDRRLANFKRVKDPVYNMQSIIEGKHDTGIKKWAIDAKKFGKPIVVNFGVEVNGPWFPWNGLYNGGKTKDSYGDKDWPDGPERFRDAYRHVIDIFTKESVKNVTWAFHLSWDNPTNEDWNKFKWYYPGDDYIDWIGVSFYGASKPGNKWKYFSEMIANCYEELASLSKDKPLGIFEMGCSEAIEGIDKPKWIDDAFSTLESGKYDRIKCVCWWNDKWSLKDGTQINMRIDSSQKTLETYQSHIKKDFYNEIAKLR